MGAMTQLHLNWKAMSNQVVSGPVRPNRSLEWTSAIWPRYGHQFIMAGRGQLSPAPQLQR